MWFGKNQRKHNLSSSTHCCLFLTIILLKALHSVSSWSVRCEINSASMSGVLGLSFLAFCRYRVLYWSSGAAWPRHEVGTGASFDSPRDEDFAHAICCTDSCRNVRVISLSRFFLDHRWEFAECRIDLVLPGAWWGSSFSIIGRITIAYLLNLFFLKILPKKAFWSKSTHFLVTVSYTEHKINKPFTVCVLCSRLFQMQNIMSVSEVQACTESKILDLSLSPFLPFLFSFAKHIILGFISMGKVFWESFYICRIVGF